MKMGFRTPSPKRSFSARTTGRVKRAVKSSINPLYGKKGMGYINDPQKAVYNKVYNKTTIGANQVFNGSSSVSQRTFDSKNAVTRVKQLNETVSIINSTTNVSVFFSRFEFALQICDELKKYEYTGCLKNISSAQQKRELVKQIPAVINSLIVRCYDKELAKAQELKTDKGRHNRMVRFFDNLVSELNQYGSKYITDTNISKIHELATSIGVDSEVNINLTPVTLSLPEVESTAPPTPAYTPPIKSDKKMLCPKCKGTFINHTRCPDCGCSLINASEDAYEYADKHTSDGYGCSLTLVFACVFIFLPLIGIPLIMGGMTGLGSVLLIIYAIILLIAYGVNKSNQ